MRPRSCAHARLIAFALIAGAMGCGAVGHPTGDRVEPAREPEQHELAPGEAPPFNLRRGDLDWKVSPQARIRIDGRVLSRRRYRSGWQAEFSPVDFALGWDSLADPASDRWIKWSQSSRWYRYRYRADSPLQSAEIVPRSANVHILPATPNLRRAVLAVGRNQRVRLEGLLVNLASEDGDRQLWWTTSLSRRDDGDGSCELLWLERLVVDGREYR